MKNNNVSHPDSTHHQTRKPDMVDGNEEMTIYKIVNKTVPMEHVKKY